MEPLGESAFGKRGASRGARAVQAIHLAERLETRPAFDWSDRVLKPGEARRSREEGQRLLTPNRELIRGGTEVAQRPAPGDPWDSKRASLIDTLETPDMIGVEAAEQRASYLMDVDILSVGLDAAKTTGATNSLEKMLVHQLAAAHRAAMRHVADAIGPRTLRELPPVDRVRLTNASARLMEVFQNGFVALQRVRTGGRQEVLVQHVQVGDGGQAIVTHTVNTPKRRGARRGRK